MKKIVIGILAHVDSGKTTLSEALLYKSGAIRNPGRVDHGDSFLDTEKLERSRGITIFSKQALFSYGDTDFTLLDTPGHIDFSAETERVMSVLDYALLVINGNEGV
ncbi:MAG: GTP-binding protein, partial [Clostridia bacterium]|nr:GTP-binding protein [Clostridia bacterium]